MAADLAATVLLLAVPVLLCELLWTLGWAAWADVREWMG